jgi:hypothetical protein
VEEGEVVNLATTIKLYATAAGTASEGSSLVSPNMGNDLRVKDIARRRLVKTNPDVDAAKLSPDSQSDNAAFVGKKYRVEDISYGNIVSEHDSTESAQRAATGRPYSRVIGPNTTSGFQLQSNPKVRDMVRRKLARTTYV